MRKAESTGHQPHVGCKHELSEKTAKPTAVQANQQPFAKHNSPSQWAETDRKHWRKVRNGTNQPAYLYSYIEFDDYKDRKRNVFERILKLGQGVFVDNAYLVINQGAGQKGRQAKYPVVITSITLQGKTIKEIIIPTIFKSQTHTCNKQKRNLFHDDVTFGALIALYYGNLSIPAQCCTT